MKIVFFSGTIRKNLSIPYEYPVTPATEAKHENTNNYLETEESVNITQHKSGREIETQRKQDN